MITAAIESWKVFKAIDNKVKCLFYFSLFLILVRNLIYLDYIPVRFDPMIFESGKLAYRLSLGIFTSFIFYVVVIHIPEYSKRRNLNPYIFTLSDRLITRFENEKQHLFLKNSLRDKNFKVLIEKIKSESDSDEFDKSRVTYFFNATTLSEFSRGLKNDVDSLIRCSIHVDHEAFSIVNNIDMDLCRVASYSYPFSESNEGVKPCNLVEDCLLDKIIQALESIERNVYLLDAYVNSLKNKYSHQ
ncbi:hypothetical protein [Gilvimarinus xylanilyticus]|uniref:Uncharacterized protein n=1 Tax=Gilvimarinus xylanilyticus TaxID=2944139 RepID=A0A9X2KUC0_9GAMM|nr:hypothetical protein [Gilvimarinus xylanilyticus]MCP8899668.1 hypothetical protein [Gilvimarinus xylanilyticus]